MMAKWSKYTAILFLAFLCVKSRGQNLYLGGKAGLNSFISLGNSLDPIDLEPDNGYQTQMSGEIFCNYATKGRWAYELGFAGTSRVSSYLSYSTPFYGKYYRMYDKTEYYLLNISAQYDIRCKQWRESKRWGGVKISLGAGLSGGIAKHTSSYSEPIGYPVATKPVKIDEGRTYGGLIYLVQRFSYVFDRHWSFIFTTDIKTMPWQIRGDGNANAFSCSQVGVFYRIY